MSSAAQHMQEREHSPFGWSGAHRWMRCALSVAVSRGIPDDGEEGYASNEPAQEGTAAHSIVDRALREGNEAWFYACQKVRVGEQDYEVDGEMVDAVQVMLDVCREDVGQREWIEDRVTAYSISTLLYGSLDFGRLNHDHLKIVDFKYGKGISVSAERNPQPMGYALSLLDTHLLWDTVKTVECVIVQPRDFHNDVAVRTVTYSADDIKAWAKEEVTPAFTKALERHPLPNPGKWCRYCPGAMFCSAARDQVAELVALTPADVTDEHLGELLHQSDAAVAVAKGLRREAEARARNGGKVPGWKLVQGLGNRVFKPDAEPELKKVLGDALYETKMRSPASIEKLGKAAKGLVAQYAFRPSGELKLVPADARGDEVTTQSARELLKAVRKTDV